jgi:hypothetical protein
MTTSRFSYGKSATQWNVLIYLLLLDVGFTTQKQAAERYQTSSNPNNNN